MTAGPIAYTLFCDDVRHEEGHKYSAMGVYVTTLELEAEEQVLPKFVALTMLELPLSVVGKPGRIRLQDGDKVLIAGDVIVDPFPEVDPDKVSRFMAAIPIEGIPFAAKNGMRLQVVFELGEFLYESSVLEVSYQSIRVMKM